ncbi:MAG: hypothetical protein A2046_10290 [Bacteroidetes bacterium GWA2_30_7]|nr:MAG: hypothetical protein A2046_10290 [Bacteroidetes bacterium GWA2_30_7]
MKIIIVSLFLIFICEAYSQKFAFIGDQRGATTATQQVSALIDSWNPELIVTSGDNFDLTQGTVDEQVGMFFHNYIYPYIGNFGDGDTVNRFFPTLGNHDLIGNGLDEYLSYFTLPGNERYYDFVNGNVHFYLINSNPNEIDGTDLQSIQAQWLQNNLLVATEQWKIICFHHSPYSSSIHGNNSWMDWPFQEWGATAVFAGHDHVYERIMKNNFPYFINGAGGANLYNFNTPIEGSIVRYNANYGAQLINAYSDSIVFKFININNEQIDSFTIIKQIETSSSYKSINNNILEVIKDGNFRYVKYSLDYNSDISIKIFNLFGKLIQEVIYFKKNKGVYIEKIIPQAKESVYIICLSINNKVIVSKKIF